MAKAKGFSLVETAVVLCVVGLILGGVWSASNAVREKSRQSETVTQLGYVLEGVRNFYKNKPFISDSSGSRGPAALTSYLFQQGLIPPEMLRSRSTSGGYYLLDHAGTDSSWLNANAAVGSFAIRSDTTDYKYSFVIELRGLKKATCIALAPRVTETGVGVATPLSSKIGGVSFVQKITPEEANTNCAATDNVLALTYRLRDTK